MPHKYMSDYLGYHKFYFNVTENSWEFRYGFLYAFRMLTL